MTRYDHDKTATLLELVPDGYTPGPWNAAAWEHDSLDHLCAEHEQALRNADSAEHATTLHGCWVEHKERGFLFPAMTGNGPTSEVNARLIALAPQLAEALQAAYEREGEALRREKVLMDAIEAVWEMSYDDRLTHDSAAMDNLAKILNERDDAAYRARSPRNASGDGRGS